MWTTRDWLERAEAVEDPAGPLAQAEQAACGADDWIELARAWCRRQDPVAARRCLATGVGLAQGEHWTCRRAAELAVELLDDRAEAQAILAQVEARLGIAAGPAGAAGVPVQGYEWTLLARAYADILGAAAGVQRCLAAAAAAARGPRDLCDLAEGLAELGGDPVGAARLLERAEQMALEQGTITELWMVAIRWIEPLGDRARAGATLAAATRAAPDSATLASLAMAWRSLAQDEEGIRLALARGETLAASPRDWLVLAEAYHDGGEDNRTTAWDPAGARRCLEAALAADRPAPSEEERAAIAAGWRHWLGEAGRAAEICPLGHAPESLAERMHRLEGWPADEPRALLHRLRERIGPEALLEIARADYGMAWVKHHRALLDIQSSGLLPVPLPAHLQEVLALDRWKQGASIDPIRRAFSCTVLALDAGLPSCRQAGHLCDVLAPLLESCGDAGLEPELEVLLAWLAEVLPRDEDRAWPLFGLVLTRAGSAPDDPRLPGLVDLLLEVEDRAEHPEPGAGWLFRTSSFDGYHGLWRDLAARRFRGEALPPFLRALGERILQASGTN